MKIGILKEGGNERRVALIPADVAKLKKQEVEVIVEADAGAQAYNPDADYTEAGASVGSRDEVLKCDVIVGINPPVSEDLGKIGEGKILICLLQPLTDHALVQELLDKNISALSMDAIRSAFTLAARRSTTTSR